MVIRKGQVLTVRGPDDGGLAIRLGGATGTTLNSGPLSLTWVTDGSGEITENPLKPDAPGAPRPLFEDIRRFMNDGGSWYWTIVGLLRPALAYATACASDR
jgi:hypothetical protein